MTPHYSDDTVTLYAGDCIDVMAELPDNSVDAVVTDPPYALEFMGRDWDRHDTPEAFQAWCQQWATQCLRVLKPGGHLVAFGGTRTYHRMTVAIEDAGFEVRDSLMWLYGSGFPKSHNIGKAIDKAAGATREVVGKSARHVSGKPGQRTDGLNGSATFSESVGMGAYITAPATPEAAQWDGWGTALKPAFEPIVLARKPLSGTVAANVLAYGTGGLNVDGCRIGTNGGTRKGTGDSTGVYGDGINGACEITPIDGGRWPANVVLDPEAAAILDQQSGDRPGFATQRDNTPRDGTDGTTTYGKGVGKLEPGIRDGFNDTGGASRFYYTAKADASQRPAVDGVRHPTVKPLDLMQWLVRLVTPPGGVVLEPFAGSGTTAEACVVEGFRCIAIERDPTYLPLIVQRLTKPIEVTLL